MIASASSATATLPYNGTASGGSNLCPLNPALADAVASRIAALRAADPGNARPLPVDLVTASASGLDPHISPAAADYQLERVARALSPDGGGVMRVGDHDINFAGPYTRLTMFDAIQQYTGLNVETADESAKASK